ncbi:MAG: putative PEP-binding protein, partial [Pseudomonadota bacterium]
GGNDLMQFFFAADRENERVRRRYDLLNFSFLRGLGQVVSRCTVPETALSFCGESAGRPIDAIALAAIGFRELSMRPASIGPVKRLLRAIDLGEVRSVLAEAERQGAACARPLLMDWAVRKSLPI